MEGSDSEFMKFTVPTLRAFLKARSQNVSGKQAVDCCSCYRMPKNAYFSMNLQSSGQPKNDVKTLFFHSPSPFPCDFCKYNSSGILTTSQF